MIDQQYEIEYSCTFSTIDRRWMKYLFELNEPPKQIHDQILNYWIKASFVQFCPSKFKIYLMFCGFYVSNTQKYFHFNSCMKPIRKEFITYSMAMHVCDSVFQQQKLYHSQHSQFIDASAHYILQMLMAVIYVGFSYLKSSLPTLVNEHNLKTKEAGKNSYSMN